MFISWGEDFRWRVNESEKINERLSIHCRPTHLHVWLLEAGKLRVLEANVAMRGHKAAVEVGEWPGLVEVRCCRVRRHACARTVRTRPVRASGPRWPKFTNLAGGIVRTGY